MPLVRSETANNARRENRVEPNAEENRKKRGEIRMDALEFLQCYYAMCYHRHSRNGCGDCEAQEIDCELTTDYPEKLVEAVEQWAKAHPEEAADATKPKQDEPCVKTIQDNIEGAIYRAISSNKTRIENLEYDVSVIRHNLAVLDDRIYALREKVDHTPTMEPSQTQEPKRTNKDVLLAAFPDAYIYPGGVPMACPLSLDKHYDCCKFKNCEDCRCAHWLAEVEE